MNFGRSSRYWRLRRPSWSGGRRQRTARKAVSNASSSSAARTCRRLFAAYTSLRGAFARLSRPSTGRVDAPPKWSRSPRPSNASCACTSTLTGSPLPARRRLATTSSTRLLRSTASSMRLCSPWATARRWSPTSTPFPPTPAPPPLACHCRRHVEVRTRLASIVSPPRGPSQPLQWPLTSRHGLRYGVVGKLIWLVPVACRVCLVHCVFRGR